MRKTGCVCIAVLALAAAGSVQATAADCSYDRAAMLALDERAFDQDLSNGGGGWRRLAGIPGCELAAADLLRDYRQAHAVKGGIMAWHEGQMRADGGQYPQAIALFEQARKPGREGGDASWNLYVDASVAFLRKDRAMLDAAVEALRAMPYPEGSDLPPLKDGHLEFPSESGQPPFRIRWPVNIEVVEALQRCFEESYAIVYGQARCRQP